MKRTALKILAAVLLAGAFLLLYKILTFVFRALGYTPLIVYIVPLVILALVVLVPFFGLRSLIARWREIARFLFVHHAKGLRAFLVMLPQLMFEGMKRFLRWSFEAALIFAWIVFLAKISTRFIMVWYHLRTGGFLYLPGEPSYTQRQLIWISTISVVGGLTLARTIRWLWATSVASGRSMQLAAVVFFGIGFTLLVVVAQRFEMLWFSPTAALLIRWAATIIGIAFVGIAGLLWRATWPRTETEEGE
jgi:hypothetical protein